MMKMATGEGSPPPPAGCGNRVPIGFWWLQRLAAAELPIYLDIPFLGNTETGNKTTIWAGPPVNRLVPKVI